MGAAIASLYLAKHSEDIQAAVLSSPMFAINAGGMPKKLANLLINFASFTEHLCCKTGCYFPGQKNYYVKPFQHNKLSHSKLRYRLFKELFNQKSELQLGGVTIQWLKLAYKIKGKVWKLLPNISTPISVMQAGDDYIVDNQSQNEFCVKVNQLHPNSCPNGEPFTIADAWHELFFEQDVYREKAINHCLEWFDKHLQV